MGVDLLIGAGDFAAQAGGDAAECVVARRTAVEPFDLRQPGMKQSADGQRLGRVTGEDAVCEDARATFEGGGAGALQAASAARGRRGEEDRFWILDFGFWIGGPRGCRRLSLADASGWHGGVPT